MDDAVGSFDPSRFRRFRSLGWTFDEAIGDLICMYALDGDDATVMLQEEFRFPNIGLVPLDDDRRRVLHRLFDHLAVVAGLSYYKLAAPPEVVVEHGQWSAGDSGYHETLLTNGLGEFCWENDLPLLHPVWTFPHDDHGAEVVPTALDLPNGPLVPVGGGKDSCVSIEAIRAAVLSPTLVTVRRFPVIQDVIDAAALPDVAVERILDPAIRSLVAHGALNGHVPVTAIVTWAALVAALLGGHDAVVLSNERSASEGNVRYRGTEINHQWSKSADAEKLLSDALARVTPSLRSFSLLRGMSELSIAQRFGTTCDRYFPVFSSCNGAFRMDPLRRVGRWDGTCAKCQFVFLALSTVLERHEVEAIWGVDVFTVSSVSGFEALLGLTEWKPFECVGESAECRVALAVISDRPDWRDHPVVDALCRAVRSAGLWPTASDREAALTPDVIPLPLPYDGVLR